MVINIESSFLEVRAFATLFMLTEDITPKIGNSNRGLDNW